MDGAGRRRRTAAIAGDPRVCAGAGIGRDPDGAPFSAVPTAYPVKTARATYWANCAWDALAIPAMLQVDASVDGRCADCGEPIPLTFDDGVLLERDALVHFAVPPARFWENVVFT